MFPTILHINDVLPSIEGVEEFKVRETDELISINYAVSHIETFPPIVTVDDMIRRECRGLLFYKDSGRIAARRYHKFFNIGEKEESQLEAIDFTQNHVILEKLDGSMVSPVMGNDGPFMTTKGGRTDISEQANDFMNESQNTRNFVKRFLEETTWNPIFEWCSQANRVVIFHPESRLVLTAIRDKITGEYMDYDEMRKLAEEYDIEVVKTISKNNFANPEFMLNHVRGLQEEEGYVIRFDNGTMFKIKSEWYSRIHYAIESVVSARRIIDLFLNNQIDDIIPILQSRELENVNSTIKKFEEICCRMEEKIVSEISSCSTDGEFQPTLFAKNPNLTSLERAIGFKIVWDISEETAKTILMDFIQNKVLTTNTKFDTFISNHEYLLEKGNDEQ